MGKNVICVGMGNNGNDALHTGGKLSPGEIQEIELGVGAFEPTLNVQLWKNYEDEMEIYPGSVLAPFLKHWAPSVGRREIRNF